MSLPTLTSRTLSSFDDNLEGSASLHRTSYTPKRSVRVIFSRSGHISRNVKTSQFRSRGFTTKIVSDTTRGNFKQNSVRISTEETKDSAVRHLNLYHSKKRGREILTSSDFAKLAHSSSEETMAQNVPISDSRSRTRVVATTVRDGVKIISPGRNEEEFTFASLLASFGTACYNALCAIIQVVFALIPLIGVVLNFLRFFLDKLIGLIDSTGSSTDVSRQIMVFSIQFALIGILIYYMLSGLFMPMFLMLRDVVRKLLLFT